MPQSLTKDMIAHPALWRLSILVDGTSAHIAINTPLEDHALIYRHIEFDQSLSPLKAFEEIIYSNPLLLSDFKTVDILIGTNRFIIVPAEVTDADVRDGLLRQLWPDDGFETMSDDLPVGETLLYSIDSGLANFIRRTFLDANVCHPMSVLIRYFSRQSQQGNTSKLYCHLRPDAVDMIGLSKGKLLVATTAAVDSPDDMAYYILATAQAWGLSLSDDEILLCGDGKVRDEVMPRLRLMARHVMPIIFPTEMFRSGKDAMHAPFPLIILPLCE